MSGYFHSLIEFLGQNPWVGILFTFVISILESIAILGSLIPGGVTMTALGFLVGSGTLPFSAIFIASIVGALIGDFLTYWFGLKNRDSIHQIWPFNKSKKIMSHGQAFFHKHGGKSVIIGRFLGPMRSVIPLIAGILNMRLLPFTFSVVISATLWTIVYILPGIFLGALSMELPPGSASKLLGYMLLFLFLAWLSIWICQYLIQTIWKYVDKFLGVVWCFLKAHPKCEPVLALIVNPKNPYDHRQFTLFFWACVFFIIFIFFAQSVYFQGLLTELNLPVFNWFQSFRGEQLDKTMVIISFFGEPTSLVIASGFILLVFLWKRAFWTAVHFGGVVFVMSVIVKGVKWIIHAKRPDIANTLAHADDLFRSFPSGHVSLSFAIFGFSSVLIANELSGKWRRLPYYIVFILVFFIALSRLYLGAHWLTDVLGGFFLSLACVLFFTISYRRKLYHTQSTQFLIALLPTVFLIAGFVEMGLNRQVLKEEYQPRVTEQIISKTAWWTEAEQDLPLYRESRFGKPIQPFNVSWVGSLEQIQSYLFRQGWHDMLPESRDFKTVLMRNVLRSDNLFRFPMVASLYHYRPAALIMTKPSENNTWLVLELWDSDIRVFGEDQPLWLGVVYISPRGDKWLFSGEKTNFNDALSALLNDLGSTFKAKESILPAKKLPLKIRKNMKGDYLKKVRLGM